MKLFRCSTALVALALLQTQAFATPVNAPIYKSANIPLPASGTFVVDSTGADASDTTNHALKVNVVAGSGSTPTGAAGTPNANVVTVQGISGGTTVPISGSVTITGALPSLATGSNTIGAISNSSFGISGTLPAFASTPTVNAAQSGTWNVTNISGTVSLPTGAATAANQMPGMFWNGATGAGSALTGSATFTGTARDVGVAQATAHPVAYFNSSFYTDQVGTAYIEASNDNSTWYTMATSAITASTPLLLSVPIVTRYYRAKVVNGAVAETVLWVNTSFTGA